MRRFVLFAPALAALVIGTPLIAQPGQSSPQSPPPYIAASAVGETRVTPDRALVQVTVDSRGESAANAGADNRAKQERVIDAVKATGVASPQIRTAGYRVYPEYAQPERGKAPKVTGYRANNTIQVEVRNVENIGRVIDAALGAGATNIGSVGLYASNTDSARREAVRLAVTKARGEAESAATAAGGTLGTVIELTIDPGAVPRPLLQNVVVTGALSAMSMGGDAPIAPMYTPVEPGESLVLAVVRLRWQFVPGAR
jgi:uncharacterized protein YggE